MKRQPRDKRRADVVVKVTGRDRGLLLALSRFRIARSSDLIRYGFPNARRDGGQRRLRKLFDAGLVSVRSDHPTHENIYSLTPKGCHELKIPATARGRIPRRGLGHHLAVVATWTDIALGVEKHPSLRLDVFQPEWAIRERIGGRRGQLVVPDGLIRLSLQRPDGSSRVIKLVLEVDLTTEHLNAFRRKLREYDQIFRSGVGLFGLQDFVLAVCARDASERRYARIRTLLKASYSGPWLLWRTAAELKDRLQHLTTPLTKDPSSKGSGAPPSRSHEETSTQGDSGKVTRRCSARGALEHDP